jgi:ATP-dependent RNA helicase DeaD
MVATDVAARGIDVRDITHVVHYSIPDDAEVYTHRSGRTARAGKAGVSMVILGPKDMMRLRQMEKQLKFKFQQGNVPSGSMIAETKLRHFFEKIARADPKLDRIGILLQELQPMLDGLDRDALIQKLVWLEFERLFHYYSLQSDSEMQSGVSATSATISNNDRSRREHAEDLPGIQINLGTRDGFYKASMLQFLLDHSGLQKADLGKIILGDAWTSIEGEQASLDQLKASFDGARFRGRGLKVTTKQAGRGGDKPAYAGPRRGSQGRPPFQRNHNR